MSTKWWKIFLNGIFAGVFIAIAGTVFLSVPNPTVGAVMFGFGLQGILLADFKLYTGAIGYLAVQGRNAFAYLVDLTAIWAGNLAGCFAVGWLLRQTRILAGISERAGRMCEVKSADGPVSILILSFFCGILMFTAVDGFKKEQLPAAARTVMVFLCVAVFILCGFEHCVANMYYFSVADAWSWHTFGWVLLMTLGNSLGGMLIPACAKLRKL